VGILLQKVVDHGLGTIDVPTVASAWTLIIAQHISVKGGLRKIEGAYTFLFNLRGLRSVL
jgi:hypothetical protein